MFTSAPAGKMSLVFLRNTTKRLSGINTLSYSIKRLFKTQSENLAAKKDGGLAKSKKSIEVETDPHVLCSRLVGGNFKQTGEDPVLKADEEYPEWLWDLKTSREAIPLEELSQDDPRYWARLKKMTLNYNFRMKKVKKL